MRKQLEGIYPLTVTLTKNDYSYEYDNLGQLVRENNLVASTAVRKKLTFASFAFILLAAFLFAALILL